MGHFTPTATQTSAAISTPMNSTTLRQNSTGCTAPPRTQRTDRNRTRPIIHRVPSPRPCSSEVVARGGIEPPTFRLFWRSSGLHHCVSAGQAGLKTTPISLYRSGKLLLDETVTAEYKLNDINEAYDDMLAGRNIRGVIIHEH